MKFNMLYKGAAIALLSIIALSATAAKVELGPRPYYLIAQLPDGELKDKLTSCQDMQFTQSDFSIGHRGAPLQFPEHTLESYVAAARMGAGILECDVTFTKDKELVCRHAQNDLHTSTNILLTDLADKCRTGFRASDGENPAQAECLTADLTLKEFLSLAGKMDGADGTAKTVEDYTGYITDWRTGLYAKEGKLLSHAKSIELFQSLGAKFTPELKAPAVEMPFNGFSQEDYAQKLVDEYKAAGIDPKDVWLQSFQLEDVLYWIENEPEFGAQAVYLDDQYNDENFDFQDPSTWEHSMQALKDMGINYIAPPLWMLVTAENGKIVPSVYAKQAKDAGLKIISWTLERSGPLHDGGGWYFQSIKALTDSDAVVFELLHVLADEIGVEGVFSDWPATTTYYANCMGL